MALRYKECGQLQRGLDGGVSTLSFSPDGTYIAIAGIQDVKVYIWRVADNKLLHTYSGSEYLVLLLEWLPGCMNTILCGSKGGYISVLRFTANISQVTGFWAHKFPVERLAVKGTQLVSGACSEVTVWRQVHTDEWSHVRDLQCPYTDSKNSEEEVIVVGIHWTKTRVHNSVVIVTYIYHGIVYVCTVLWCLLQALTHHL
ncbi:WD40-repeat-containing domain protein [Daedaleopsis nitida]|nr:WD40-repeat-containing domain protein [Daedaleopsis nitida]